MKIFLLVGFFSCCGLMANHANRDTLSINPFDISISPWNDGLLVKGRHLTYVPANLIVVVQDKIDHAKRLGKYVIFASETINHWRKCSYTNPSTTNLENKMAVSPKALPLKLVEVDKSQIKSKNDRRCGKNKVVYTLNGQIFPYNDFPKSWKIYLLGMLINPEITRIAVSLVAILNPKAYQMLDPGVVFQVPTQMTDMSGDAELLTRNETSDKD